LWWAEGLELRFGLGLRPVDTGTVHINNTKFMKVFPMDWLTWPQALFYPHEPITMGAHAIASFAYRAEIWFHDSARRAGVDVLADVV